MDTLNIYVKIRECSQKVDKDIAIDEENNRIALEKSKVKYSDKISFSMILFNTIK